MNADRFSSLVDFDSALDALADPDGRPSGAHIRALSNPSRANIDGWATRWPSIPPERQREIVTQLVEVSEAEFQVDFKSLFVWLLDDPDAANRASAVDGLWESENPYLIDRFAELLEHDPDDGVRARAASGLGRFVELGELGRFDAPRLQPALGILVAVGADEGEDAEVRRRAIESAGYADRPDVRGLIEAAIASGDRTLTAGALRAMGHSADTRWGTEVLEWLEDGDPLLSFEAAHAAGELGLRKAVAQLALLAEAGDRQVQTEAIWALGEIGGARAKRALKILAADFAEDDAMNEAVEDAMATLALAEGVLDFDPLEDRPGMPAEAGNPSGPRWALDQEGDDEDDGEEENADNLWADLEWDDAEE